MKKNLCVFFLVLAPLTAVHAQELIELVGSNQFQTTVGFEMNEYDYLINPLYFHLLTDPWAFFGLDNDYNQLAANIVGYGINTGIAFGGVMTPVFLVNYQTSSDLGSGDEAENIEITYTGYNQASGTYATVTESVSQYIKNNEYIHNLVLHGGLSVTETIGLAIQFAMIMDRWNVQRSVYTNTYSNTASPADTALTGKGDLTQTTVTMRNGSENSYKLDIETGLNLENFSSRIVLGAGWFNPGTASNSYQQVVTVYNDAAGLDDTVQDRVTTTSYSGQYYYSGGSAQPAFTMGISTDYIEFFRLGLDTTNVIPLGDELNLTVPFDFRYDIYGADLSTVAATTIVTYNDAAATPVESSRDVTTVTTTFARPLDLRVATGASVKKTFHPTDNTRLHLGGGLDFEFIGENTTWTRQSVRNYQVDNNSDGAYTTAGTDVSTVYTQSGYEAIGRTYEYNFDLTGAVAVSYNPIGILTFHAGASTVASVDLESVSTLRTGDSGYLYEAYTDNLDAANTYARRQKDGSNNLSIPSSEFYSDFSFSTVGFFGFTLDFSESFRIDARSTIGTVGFSSFSVIGLFSPEGRTP